MSGPGSGEPVVDYNALCEGDMDPHLRKLIRTLILKTPEYIVYLDDELFVEWGVTKSLNDRWKREWDSIPNEVSILEAEPTEGLNTVQVEAYRRLLTIGRIRAVSVEPLEAGSPGPRPPAACA